MITIPLARLESAATTKPQGYYEACLAAGTVVGDNLELSERAFAELRARYAPPPAAAQLRSFVGAVTAECGAAITGEDPITEAQKAARIAICEACEFFTISDRRCSKCGCWIDAKAGFRTQICPVSKWPRD
ncbi:MAG: DUF6171 family protein [Verrucomicrobiota bacterium]